MEQLSFDGLETWKPVPGYEGLYGVSDLGRVRSVPRHGAKGGIVAARPAPSGHLKVGLWVNNTRKLWSVHQLVMLAFAGPYPSGQEVRHLDGNPANNRWAPGSEEETKAAGGNLFYGTKSENLLDRVRHGTHNHARKDSCDYGHEFTPGNTYTCPSRPGVRYCKECVRRHGAEYRKRKAARRIGGDLGDKAAA